MCTSDFLIFHIQYFCYKPLFATAPSISQIRSFIMAFAQAERRMHFMLEKSPLSTPSRCVELSPQENMTGPLQHAREMSILISNLGLPGVSLLTGISIKGEYVVVVITGKSDYTDPVQWPLVIVLDWIPVDQLATVILHVPAADGHTGRRVERHPELCRSVAVHDRLV